MAIKGSMRSHFLGRAKKLLELQLVKTTNSQDQLSTIQQAFFKATTVTKDFSKCGASPFPGIVSNQQSYNSHKRVLKMPLVVVVVSISQNSTYWLLRNQDGHKRLLKVPRRLLKMPCNISWIVSITAIDLIQRQKFISWNFYESNPTKVNSEIIFMSTVVLAKYTSVPLWIEAP